MKTVLEVAAILYMGLYILSFFQGKVENDYLIIGHVYIAARLAAGTKSSKDQEE